MKRGPDRWDLFCRVVDNYGDVGIAWRLARQLAVDPARSVRLVVDGLAVLARIEPRIDAHAALQEVDGIVVRSWSSLDSEAGPVASVVVEVLGCGLPAAYLEALDAGVAWIDLEHLSAEAWVADFHGLPSPHPRLPLVKHFFYPGFGPRTGGLWLEPELDRARRAFVDDDAAIDALWRRLGVPRRVPGERRASLFAYPTAPVDALLTSLRRAGGWTLLVPEPIADRVADRVADLVDGGPLIHAIPFAGQDDYDRLLWACDLNFVRGEDSFVRAQAAARPFVWQPYRQSDDLHLIKLAAFADRYEAGLDDDSRAAHRRLWDAWNGDSRDFVAAFDCWLAAMPALRAHAAMRTAEVLAAASLVERLVAFAAARIRSGLLD